MQRNKGETDLAADRTLAMRFSFARTAPATPVGLLKSEIGIDLGERRDLAPGLEDRENLLGDRLRYPWEARPRCSAEYEAVSRVSVLDALTNCSAEAPSSGKR